MREPAFRKSFARLQMPAKTATTTPKFQKIRNPSGSKSPNQTSRTKFPRTITDDSTAERPAASFTRTAATKPGGPFLAQLRLTSRAKSGRCSCTAAAGSASRRGAARGRRRGATATTTTDSTGASWPAGESRRPRVASCEAATGFGGPSLPPLALRGTLS